VIIWSMANESKTDNEIGIKVMRALIRRTKELDPTRLVTFVTAPGSVREHRAFEEADLVATNMYHGSLSGPLADHRGQLEARARRPTEEHLRRELDAFPDRPLLISEFGAIGMHGLHGDVPGTEDFQAEYIGAVWTAIHPMPYFRSFWRSVARWMPSTWAAAARLPRHCSRVARSRGGSTSSRNRS